MTLQVTFYKNSIFSKLSILYAFTLLKVSKFRKQIFQPKLLPKNEPTNLFFYTDYEPTIFFSILTTYQDRKTNTMVWFLEELLPGKFVFDFYWPLEETFKEVQDFNSKISFKGQLISKWNCGVFKSPKKPTKFLTDFCPSFIGQKCV